MPSSDSVVKVLPSWAGGDARKFVRIMRDALEGMSQFFLLSCSEFVFVRMCYVSDMHSIQVPLHPLLYTSGST